MANWLGQYLFGETLVVENEKSKLAEGNAVINYSDEQIAVTSYTIGPVGLLTESTIRPLNVAVLPKNGVPVFFATAGHPGFDVLAAIFFLLSRYEEYLPHEKDMYGRYAHTNSLAFRNGFLQRPVVDEWMADLKAQLKAVFPQLVFTPGNFEYLPTYDVDIAWSYKHKGFKRNAAGLLRSLAQLDFKAIAERWAVLTLGKTDPFDVFETLDLLHDQYQLEPCYFLLLADKATGYDKNISPSRSGYRSLVRGLAGKYETGIHLSWQASASKKTMESEIATLENITGEKPVANRMHYISFQLPQTFQVLCSLGISKEYSMGYGSINGFRAGTCTPFYWYDLSTETATGLRVFPYCYMDANSIFEQQDDTVTALAELQQYHDTVKKHGGLLITIFHNHLIGLSPQGRQWMEMYRRFLARNF